MGDDDKFTLLDSGARASYDSGMVRDTNTDKTLWHLVASGPMLQRYAEHMTKGAAKYGQDNWLKAAGEIELQRFRESAFRHFMQWWLGDVDEDHAAAVMFNINGAEYVKARMAAVNIQVAVEHRPPYLCCCAVTGRITDDPMPYERTTAPYGLDGWLANQECRLCYGTGRVAVKEAK